MTTQFKFELVSPEEKVISEPAFQVTIPGQEGDVGVRAGHMSLVVAIRPGVVTVLREENGTPEKIFIAGGFADVGQDHLTVLAEESVPVESLSREKLDAEMAHLDEEAKLAESDMELARIDNKRTVVLAMLSAIAA